MNSPYCGWNKNSNGSTPEECEFDFLQFMSKEEIEKNTHEMNSFHNTVEQENDELN